MNRRLLWTRRAKAIYQADHAGYTGPFQKRPATLTKITQESEIDVRRKRLMFRSWHRGMRELDLLLGTFAEYHLADFSERQLDIYERFIEYSDPDIYRWLTDAEPPPKAADSDVFVLLKNFRNTS